MICKRILLGLLLLNAFFINAQTLNKLDENGKKDGLWKGTYEESKRPRYEGIFNHGKETGVFKFYDDTKAASVIATRDFSANDGSAYTIFYDQAKNKVSEGKVINKLFHGEWKYYHQASPTVMTIENYSKGKLNGLRSVFYPNGKIAEEMNYSKDVKEGAYKRYAENGTILEQLNYKNNELDGDAVFNNSNGVVASKGIFRKGKKMGNWQFFENGKLVKEVNMSDPKNTNETATKVEKKKK